MDAVTLSALAALVALCVVVWLALPPRYRVPVVAALGGVGALALAVLRRPRPPRREPDLPPITEQLAAGEQEAVWRIEAEHLGRVEEIEERATLSDEDRQTIAAAEWARRRKRGNP